MDRVSPEQRSRNMARVKSRNTGLELKVRSLISHMGYRYRLYRSDLPGTPDIVFPGRRSVIFIHGCFWHGHVCKRAALPASNRTFWQRKITKNQARDERARCELLAGGWKILTIWECESRDVALLRKILLGFLGASGRK